MPVPEEIARHGDAEGADRRQRLVQAKVAAQQREDGEVDQVAGATNEPELGQLPPAGGFAGRHAQPVNKLRGAHDRGRTLPPNVPVTMRTRTATAVVACAAAATVAAVLALGGGKSDITAGATSPPAPGEPTVTVISPRNGARQHSRAVVVKVEVENFH